MRVIYAGWYDITPEYMEKLKHIPVIHTLRSYYYKHDLERLMNKVREFNERMAGEEAARTPADGVRGLKQREDEEGGV